MYIFCCIDIRDVGCITFHTTSSVPPVPMALIDMIHFALLPSCWLYYKLNHHVYIDENMGMAAVMAHPLIELHLHLEPLFLKTFRKHH